MATGFALFLKSPPYPHPYPQSLLSMLIKGITRYLTCSEISMHVIEPQYLGVQNMLDKLVAIQVVLSSCLDLTIKRQLLSPPSLQLRVS